MKKTDEQGTWECESETGTASVWLLTEPTPEWKAKRSADFSKTKEKVPT